MPVDALLQASRINFASFRVKDLPCAILLLIIDASTTFTIYVYSYVCVSMYVDISHSLYVHAKCVFDVYPCELYFAAEFPYE